MKNLSYYKPVFIDVKNPITGTITKMPVMFFSMGEEINLRSDEIGDMWQNDKSRVVSWRICG